MRMASHALAAVLAAAFIVLLSGFSSAPGFEGRTFEEWKVWANNEYGQQYSWNERQFDEWRTRTSSAIKTLGSDPLVNEFRPTIERYYVFEVSGKIQGTLLQSNYKLLTDVRSRAFRVGPSFLGQIIELKNDVAAAQNLPPAERASRLNELSSRAEELARQINIADYKDTYSSLGEKATAKANELVVDMKTTVQRVFAANVQEPIAAMRAVMLPASDLVASEEMAGQKVAAAEAAEEFRVRVTANQAFSDVEKMALREDFRLINVLSEDASRLFENTMEATSSPERITPILERVSQLEPELESAIAKFQEVPLSDNVSGKRELILLINKLQEPGNLLHRVYANIEIVKEFGQIVEYERRIASSITDAEQRAEFIKKFRKPLLDLFGVRDRASDLVTNVESDLTMHPTPNDLAEAARIKADLGTVINDFGKLAPGNKEMGGFVEFLRTGENYATQARWNIEITEWYGWANNEYGFTRPWSSEEYNRWIELTAKKAVISDPVLDSLNKRYALFEAAGNYRTSKFGRYLNSVLGDVENTPMVILSEAETELSSLKADASGKKPSARLVQMVEYLSTEVESKLGYADEALPGVDPRTMEKMNALGREYDATLRARIAAVRQQYTELTGVSGTVGPRDIVLGKVERRPPLTLDEAVSRCVSDPAIDAAKRPAIHPAVRKILGISNEAKWLRERVGSNAAISNENAAEAAELTSKLDAEIIALREAAPGNRNVENLIDFMEKGRGRPIYSARENISDIIPIFLQQANERGVYLYNYSGVREFGENLYKSADNYHPAEVEKSPSDFRFIDGYELGGEKHLAEAARADEQLKSLPEGAPESQRAELEAARQRSLAEAERIAGGQENSIKEMLERMKDTSHLRAIYEKSTGGYDDLVRNRVTEPGLASMAKANAELGDAHQKLRTSLDSLRIEPVVMDGTAADIENIQSNIAAARDRLVAQKKSALLNAGLVRNRVITEELAELAAQKAEFVAQRNAILANKDVGGEIRVFFEDFGQRTIADFEALEKLLQRELLVNDQLISGTRAFPEVDKTISDAEAKLEAIKALIAKQPKSSLQESARRLETEIGAAKSARASSGAQSGLLGDKTAHSDAQLADALYQRADEIGAELEESQRARSEADTRIAEAQREMAQEAAARRRAAQSAGQRAEGRSQDIGDFVEHADDKRTRASARLAESPDTSVTITEQEPLPEGGTRTKTTVIRGGEATESSVVTQSSGGAEPPVRASLPVGPAPGQAPAQVGQAGGTVTAGPPATVPGAPQPGAGAQPPTPGAAGAGAVPGSAPAQPVVVPVPQPAGASGAAGPQPTGGTGAQQQGGAAGPAQTQPQATATQVRTPTTTQKISSALTLKPSPNGKIMGSAFMGAYVGATVGHYLAPSLSDIGSYYYYPPAIMWNDAAPQSGLTSKYLAGKGVDSLYLQNLDFVNSRLLPGLTSDGPGGKNYYAAIGTNGAFNIFAVRDLYRQQLQESSTSPIGNAFKAAGEGLLTVVGVRTFAERYGLADYFNPDSPDPKLVKKIYLVLFRQDGSQVSTQPVQIGRQRDDEFFPHGIDCEKKSLYSGKASYSWTCDFSSLESANLAPGKYVAAVFVRLDPAIFMSDDSMWPKMRENLRGNGCNYARVSGKIDYCGFFAGLVDDGTMRADLDSARREALEDKSAWNHFKESFKGPFEGWLESWKGEGWGEHWALKTANGFISGISSTILLPITVPISVLQGGLEAAFQSIYNSAQDKINRTYNIMQEPDSRVSANAMLLGLPMFEEFEVGGAAPAGPIIPEVSVIPAVPQKAVECRTIYGCLALIDAKMAGQIFGANYPASEAGASAGN